jgi:hypothetical protein
MFTIHLDLVPGRIMVGAVLQLAYFLGMVILNIVTILRSVFFTIWVEYNLCNMQRSVPMSHSIC